MTTEGENNGTRITRWSGVWRRGNEVRVGVRLDDGSDGLLVAAWQTEGVDPNSEAEIVYTLLIMGEVADVEPQIPASLRAEVEKKLAHGSHSSTMTLKDISLF